MSNGQLDLNKICNYAFIFIFGVVLGSLAKVNDLFSPSLPIWLSAIGTFLAVVAALYTTRLNIERDTHKLKCTYCLIYYPVPDDYKGIVSNPEIKAIKKLTIKAVNIGLRPIAIDSVSVKNFNISKEKIKITNEPASNGLPTHCILQPGDFREWVLPDNDYPNQMIDIHNCDFFVVDAIGVRHKAVEKHLPSF